MTELVTPSGRYRASWLAARAEAATDGDEPATDATFAAQLVRIADYAAGRVKPGHVAETVLWLVDGDEYIGRISLRHALTPDLRRVGGHVGYDVRPSRRRQGHATRMLALAIPRLAALGVDPALITCDVDNLASRKVIEANGGAPADDGVVVPGTLRYWLPTKSRS